MLVFIIPLKSKQVSQSWERVCQLFERCVRSLCQQTNPNFRVIVVCSEIPDIQFSHPHLQFVTVDFPPPEMGATVQEKDRDKGKRLMTGLMYARQFCPSHVMFVDADDCLSCHLAAFTNQAGNDNGWYVDRGYVYCEGSQLIYYRKSQFNRWCGSCNIVRFDLLPLPTEANPYPPDLLLYYSGETHRVVEARMRAAGTPLSPLPFVGAIYTIGNYENIYQKGFGTLHHANRGKILFQIKESLKFRLLLPSMRREFGLYKIEQN